MHVLGYCDSGMFGTPAHNRPDIFLHADREEVNRRVAHLFRAVCPDAPVTCDERGGHGRPDHVTAHQVTSAAIDAAAEPDRYPDFGLLSWSVPRFYNSANPRSIWNWIAEEILICRAARLIPGKPLP